MHRLLPAALALYGAVAQHRALAAYRAIPALPPGEPLERPLVSMVVPARDEEANLRTLLPTLAALDYEPRELIVVDDDSSDGTARVAAEHGARVVATGGPPPEGWAGKPRACVLGADAARGEWLLFVDADTRHRPGSLSAALAYAQAAGADALSLLLDQDLGSFWERLVLPFAYAGYFAGVGSVNRDAADALVNGQYLLIRRTAYASIGGYASVKGSVLEDVALAKELARHGCRVELLRADGMAGVRMYRDRRSVLAGFAKHSFAAIRLQPGRGLRIAAATAGAAGALPAALGLRQSCPLLGALVLALALSAHGRWARAFGAPAAYGALQPLAGLLVLGAALRGGLAAVGGPRVAWKGRRYRP